MDIPRHIAIIMDGNRRYAKEQKKPKLYGHKKGADALEATLHACIDFGVQELTVYAFSTENFNRPAEEKDYLMKLLVDKSKELVAKPEVEEKQIAVRYIGRTTLLPKSVQETIKAVEKQTADHHGFTLNFCVAYGGRSEITDACKAIAQEVAEGKRTPDSIDEAVVAEHLYLPSEPDLIIRTSEQRISNFLPWQGAYAEIIFLPEMYWPDFSKETLESCIAEYSRRKRRFGA